MGCCDHLAKSVEAAAKDPVCGMEVSTKAFAGSTSFKGNTYYFCSQGCLEKFQANPEKYRNSLHNQVADRKSSAEGHAEYTCPMHPEVTQATPGTCPKCGMALEPTEIVPPASQTQYTCPMHPEILRSERGNCPICGMALEPRLVTVSEANPELADMSSTTVVDRAWAEVSRVFCSDRSGREIDAVFSIGTSGGDVQRRAIRAREGLLASGATPVC